MKRPAVMRRSLLALAAAALVWAALIALTGGFGTEIAGIRVSSRSIRNPLLLAIVALSGAVALGGPDRRRVLSDDLRRLRGWAYVTSVAAWAGAALLTYDWASGRPLWLDEEMIALNIRDRGLLELAGPLWLGQAAPLGWLLTQRVAAIVFGIGETALRLTPVLFGVAALAAAALIGRRWMTTAGALTLVVLLALGQWVFHYSLELKHYSGDVLFGLALPALVVWALAPDTVSGRLRRAAIWWVIAALAQWWSYGAVFVTPAGAAVLCLSLWRTDGWRSAAWAAAFGVVWVAAFGLHYLVALRFAVESPFLREYWAMAIPPASAGVADTLRWLVDRLGPFAEWPGGTTLAPLFWATAVCGFAFARPRLFGLVFAAVPLSAFALGALRLVPLYERLSLWAVPAMYVGIALGVDAALRWARESERGVPRTRAAAAFVVLLAALWVGIDIVRRGWQNIVNARPVDTNHELDDRAAVTWLAAQRRPGDAIATTALALPAVWWYADVPLNPPHSGGALTDGNPVFEIVYHPLGPECDDEALRQTLAPYKRLLVYLGFRFDDVPDNFDDLLVEEADRIGTLTELARFPGVSRVAIVEIGSAREGHTGHPNGCLSVRPARRW